MIIQKWSARTKPMQLRDFVAALKLLNALYLKAGRVPWGRVHHELYGGHRVIMEREFNSIAELDADETKADLPEIREAKARLLDTCVPGSVSVEHYHSVDLESTVGT